MCELRYPLAQFAAKTKDDALRKASTSGGAFTELARIAFVESGIVIGAGWAQNPFRVVHKVARDEEGLSEMRGAKYAPSDISGVFNIMDAELRSGRHVLFTGTPCQVAAARKRFGENDHLILCAIICHSVPEQDVWDAYVNELERKAKSRIVGMKFRDKGGSDGWRKSSVVVDFADETKRITEPSVENVYDRVFFAGYSTRAACATCPFRGGQHGADLQIGDCWGIEEICPSFDDGRGVSVVMAYTERGLQMLRKTKLELMPVTYEQVLAHNPHIEQGLSLGSVERKRFLSTYKRFGFERALRYAKDGPWYRRVVVRIYRRIRYGGIS